MHLKIKDKSTILKELIFEIPVEEITKKINDAYNKLKKTTVLKGFRKGKIPRKVLENRFAKNVHNDIAQNLIQESFAKALKDNNLIVVSNPNIDPPELDPLKAYTFNVEIEVKPELENFDFKGIKLEKTKYEISKTEIDSQLKMIQKTMATKEVIKQKRAVKKEDFVLIDYEGFLDSKPYDKTPKVQDFTLKIGQSALPKEFSQSLTGQKANTTVDVIVPYPDDYYDEQLKSKTINYKVKLKQIQKEVFPKIDDKLAKSLGKYETLDELKKEILKNLESGYQQRIKHELSEQIFKTLLKKQKFSVPDSMVEMELKSIINEANQATQMQNINLEDQGINEETLRVRYKDLAKKQARRHLILDKIINQEALELTKEEIDQGITEMSIGMRMPKENIENYFKNTPAVYKNFKHSQLEKKAIDLIIDQSKIIEIEPEKLKDKKDGVKKSTKTIKDTSTKTMKRTMTAKPKKKETSSKTATKASSIQTTKKAVADKNIKETKTTKPSES